MGVLSTSNCRDCERARVDEKARLSYDVFNSYSIDNTENTYENRTILQSPFGDWKRCAFGNIELGQRIFIFFFSSSK